MNRISESSPRKSGGSRGDRKAGAAQRQTSARPAAIARRLSGSHITREVDQRHPFSASARARSARSRRMTPPPAIAAQPKAKPGTASRLRRCWHRLGSDSDRTLCAGSRATPRGQRPERTEGRQAHQPAPDFPRPVQEPHHLDSHRRRCHLRRAGRSGGRHRHPRHRRPQRRHRLLPGVQRGEVHRGAQEDDRAPSQGATRWASHFDSCLGNRRR